ncbi:MAG TPA: aspartate--tRNA(Asn) ligase [Thermoplasmata archaeon]|nr:aspartate--tRNA(Asn) ligase [Thermoplasmata archaeon]
MPSFSGSFTSLGPSDRGKAVVLAGWVEDVRNLGGIAFLIVRQREGTFQTTVKKKGQEALFETASKLVRESVVAVHGTLQPNPQVRNGWELLATSVDVLSAAAAPLPLPVADKVGAEMDTRFDNRTLDLRKPERRAIFRVRSVTVAALRESLVRQGFVEVDTPKLSGAGAEGGATLFETDYFGRKAYLSQSPQLYKQMLMSTGLDRVFEVAPAFRAEPSDTVRHVTEFTSFDAEAAWIEDQEDVLRFLETAVAHAIEQVRAETKPELDLLHADPQVPKLPLRRLPYAEALEILRGHGKRARDGDDIDTEGEKVLGAALGHEGHELFFLTEYPSGIKPFYIMSKADEPDVSWSFDLEYKGDEMASGGQREHRYDVLVQRMQEKGLAPESFEFYLKAFRYGMPPHGGWGFGVDRFTQKLLDLPNIREAILFPHDRVRLVP